jgi:FHS family L-fucose permease-like MFS transporter
MTRQKNYIYPLVIIGFLFFAFGFLTWINGILIPYFQICLELSNAEAALVSFAVYIAYFVMALPSAWILKFTGYRKGIVWGLIIMAAGTLLFIPAAYSRTYAIFLLGLFITGAGVTLLQTAANPYVAIIGPIESTAQRIGFMGLANKFAGILSTAILGSIFLFDADSTLKTISTVNQARKAEILGEFSLKVVEPYLVITVLLLLLAVLIFFSKMPEIDESKQQDDEGSTEIVPKASIFSYPYLILGVIALFVSAACEGIPIDGIIIYSRALGIPIEEARYFTQYSLYAMILGYIGSIVLIPKFMSQEKALMYCSVLGIGATVASYYSNGIYSIYYLILTAFGGAMLWGIIWGLAIRDLGKYTKLGSALLLMSVVGGGLFPLLFGQLLDDNINYPQNAVLLLIPCYAILLLFSLWGYRKEEWSLMPKS